MKSNLIIFLLATCLQTSFSQDNIRVIKGGRLDTVNYDINQQNGVIKGGMIGTKLPPITTNLLGYWDQSYGIESDSTIILRNTGHNPVDTIKLNGVDFSLASGYIPLKTAATLQAISVIPVDTQYFGSVVKNIIYPTTVPANVDFNNRIFFKTLGHTVASDSSETLPARIIEIAIYSTAKSGIDSAILWTYFSVPYSATAKWVDGISGNDATGNGTRSAPYKTLAKMESVITGTNPTVYIKSGIYAETSAFKCFYPAKNALWTAIGRVEIRGTTDGSYGLFVQGTNRIDINRIVINAESRINNTYLYAGGSAQTTLNNCVFKGGSAYQLDARQSGSPILNKCVFVDLTTTANVNMTATLNINESYLGNTSGGTFFKPLTNAGISLKLKWNKIVTTGMASVYVSSTIGPNLLFTGNDVIIEGCYNFSTLTAGTAGYRINANNIHASLIDLGGFRTTSTTGSYKVEVLNNHVYNTSAGPVFFFQNTKWLKCYNNTYIGDSTAFIVVSKAAGNSTMDSVHIYNNSISCMFLSGYAIKIGEETTTAFDNLINDIKIYNNLVLGDNYFNPTSQPSHHGIFVGFNKNAHIFRNYIIGSGLSIVVKGSIGTRYTSGGVYNNVVINPSSYGIYSKGVSGVNIYNNTISRGSMTSTTAYGIHLSVNSGGDGADTCIIRNNIISMATGTNIHAYYMDALSNNMDTIDYNVVYGTATIGKIATTGYNYSQWQALGYDANSFNVNPNFTSSSKFWPVTSFVGENLVATYDDGIDISTTWGSSTTVPHVVTKQQGAAWQIGAYVK